MCWTCPGTCADLALRACNHSRSWANGRKNNSPVRLQYYPLHDVLVDPEAGPNPLALARYPWRAPDALAAARGTAVHGRIAISARCLRLHHAGRRDGSGDGNDYVGSGCEHGVNMPADETYGCGPGAMCQTLCLRCVCSDRNSSAVSATQCSGGSTSLVANCCRVVVADDGLPEAT